MRGRSLIPGIGLLTLVSLVGLVLAELFFPSFRQKNVAFVTGVGGLIFLIALATGAFRGDNNNLGMPSGRYTDLFIIVPLLRRGLMLIYAVVPGALNWLWAFLPGYGWVFRSWVFRFTCSTGLFPLWRWRTGNGARASIRSWFAM